MLSLRPGVLLVALILRQEGAAKEAERWLGLVDEGKYEESWGEASAGFRENMARFGKSTGFWVRSLETSRKPLGERLERKLTRTGAVDAMPGTPEGREYLEVEYESRFAEADAVAETVVMRLDEDGAWRVFNYVIRRRE